jgi:hypothetical protein
VAPWGGVWVRVAALTACVLASLIVLQIEYFL